MNFNPGDFEILDAHIHPVPGNIPGTDLSLFGSRTDPAKTVEELRAAGISRAAGAVIRRFRPVPASFAEIHELNEACLAIRDRFPDFYLPGIGVHPLFPEASCREIEVMHRDCGVRLVGELVAYMMGYDNYACPELDPVWALIRDLDMAVNLHLNRLEEAADILRRFPTLKLIIAHPTASPADYTARLELIAQYPNAALDISGSGPNSWGMVRHGIRTAGLDRIVFGTDYPIRNPGMYVAGVYAEKLTDAEMTAVFSGNLKRLLGLD